jgi:hypothetical protein
MFLGAGMLDEIFGNHFARKFFGGGFAGGFDNGTKRSTTKLLPEDPFPNVGRPDRTRRKPHSERSESQRLHGSMSMCWKVEMVDLDSDITLLDKAELLGFYQLNRLLRSYIRIKRVGIQSR